MSELAGELEREQAVVDRALARLREAGVELDGTPVLRS